MEGNDKIFNGIERFALTSQDWKLVRGFLDVLYVSAVHYLRQASLTY